MINIKYRICLLCNPLTEFRLESIFVITIFVVYSTNKCIVLTQNVRLVVYEEVSGDYCLVSGQDDLLQKVVAKVLLYPGVLEKHTVNEKLEEVIASAAECVDWHWQRAYLLIWAVLVMFYRAGANKDICAAEREGNNST